MCFIPVIIFHNTSSKNYFIISDIYMKEKIKSYIYVARFEELIFGYIIKWILILPDTVSKSVSEMNQKRAGTCMPAPKFVI